MGGLGIADPSQTVKDSLYISRKATQIIVQAINGDVSYETETHNENVFAVRAEAKDERAKKNQAKYNDIFEQSDKCHQRVMERMKGNKVSSSLTVLPIERSHFDLSAQEFRDALALRYKKLLLSLP